MSVAERTTLRTTIFPRLDRMPWGRFHTLLVIGLGLGWMLDSFEINIIGSVYATVAKLWKLNAFQASLATSAWVFGILIGALLFGYLSDRLGRKNLFLLTLVWYAAFSVLTMFSWNYPVFLTFRFLTALGVGGEYSAVTAAMGEFIPVKHRGKTDALILSGFPLGAILSAVAAYSFINLLPPQIGWRLGFGLGAILAISGLWIRKVIPESPRWLLLHGQGDKAEAIVENIEKSVEAEKGITLEPVTETVEINSRPEALGADLHELFVRYLERTGVASFWNFSQASVVYGVTVLLALVVLPTVHVPASAAPIYIFLGNVAALIGGVGVAFALDGWGRRSSVLFGYFFTALALVYLYFAHSLTEITIGYCLVQFGVTWAYIAAYVLTAEILPTRVRASGLGVSVAAGRLGAFFAPLLITNAFLVNKSASAALLVLLLLVIPGPLASLWWRIRGKETRHRGLELTSGEFTASTAVAGD